MKGALLPFLALWMRCYCFEGACAKQRLSLSAPAAPPVVPVALPTLQLPLSPARSSNGPEKPDRPEDEQLDGPQGWAGLTPKEQVHRAPDWKVPASMGLALRKEPPPVTSGQAKGLVTWQGTQQAQPQAAAVLEAGALKPRVKKFRPLKAGRTPGTQKGAVATGESQERKAGGRETTRRAPKPRRPTEDTCRPSRPGAWHQQKDQSRGRGSGSSTSQATGCVWKRPGSRRGPGPGLTSLSSREQAIPSLPASCLLTQAAIACGNANMKHIPALVEPGLTSLYLAENEIAKIPAHAFLGLPNLEWLDLSKNKLDTRGLHPHAFKNLTQLKRLNLDGNSLSTVPALPTSLQELKLNDNLLQGLQHSSFWGLSKLLTLEVEGNKLHDGNISPLAFRSLHNLLYLRLDRNRLRTIPPGLPASLQELHLGNNLLEEVTENVLNRSHSLNVLVLSHNQLQEDRLAPRAWIDLPKLETLDLSHNRLVHVPSFLPRGLRHLTLHHNLIERIPGYVFAHMKPGLEFLHLSYNRLRTEGMHTVSFLGLHTSLAELLLDHNQLQAIPRGLLELKGLRVLGLSHNKIRQVPLNSICDTRVAQDSNLIATYLDNNLIDLRRIPSTAFSCIRTYHSVVLKPQRGEEGS